MSGIFGIIQRAGNPVAPGDLERLRGAMMHRGPDGSEVWTDGPAGLGQLMLRSTPESLEEKLPWRDPESGIVIAADARIDNREELFGKLLEKPSRMNSLLQGGSGDSLYILAAWLRWGEDCVDHLQGDFAFAIWDPRCRELFCARDRMGAAPLCYAVTETFFAFASEPECLLLLPGVSPQPNERLIAHIFLPAFENLGDDRTWQRDIRALMPAHAMTVPGNGDVRIRNYWRLEPDDQEGCISEEDCLERFIEIFREAVRRRLRAPGDVAVMMSGGLDSAGTAAMADRLLRNGSGQTLCSYSAVDDDPSSSVESRAILSMAESLAVSPHYVSVPSFRGMVDADDLRRAAWQAAHPVDNRLLLPAMMCLAASRDGNRVMLDGASGDMTMKQPGLYPAISLRRGKWLKAWRECVDASRNHVHLRHSSPLSLLRQNAWAAFAPAALKRRRWRSRQADVSALIQSSLLRRAFADEIDLADRLEEQTAREERAMLAPPGYRSMNSDLEYIRWGLAGFGRVAARYGVEVRDPWADPGLVRFFRQAPPEHLLKGGWTKYPVRRSFEPDLAPEVLWRRDKEHLGWKFTERVMSDSREMIDGLMKSGIEILEEYVDLDSARSCHERWVATGDSASREQLFELVTMSLWLRRVMSL